jgi:hypothetical protein
MKRAPSDLRDHQPTRSSLHAMRATAGAVGASLLLSASTLAAPLTGDVFVTMQSGDVKRAADVDVLVVPATPEFDSALERLRVEFEEASKPIQAEYNELYARYRAAYDEWNAAAERLKRSPLNQEVTGQYRRLSDEVSRLSGAMSRNWKTRSVPLAESYRDAIFRLISERAAARTATDVNGHFEVDVRAESYYVFSRYQLREEVLYWLVPVQVPDSGAKVSLSNGNGTPTLLQRPETTTSPR